MFINDQRTDQEKDAFEYVKKLTNWRKTAAAVHNGKMVHFIPENNTYVYFRYTDDAAVMVVMNRNEKSTSISRNRFSEILDQYKTGVNAFSGEVIDVTKDFQIGSKQTAIFDLYK